MAPPVQANVKITPPNVLFSSSEARELFVPNSEKGESDRRRTHEGFTGSGAGNLSTVPAAPDSAPTLPPLPLAPDG